MRRHVSRIAKVFAQWSIFRDTIDIHGYQTDDQSGVERRSVPPMPHEARVRANRGTLEWHP